MKVNNRPNKLTIDTRYKARLSADGVSGLLISRAAAQHAGLRPIFQKDMAGIGGKVARLEAPHK